MSQARSVGALALEIGAVAAVVMLLPKINLQPASVTSAAPPATAAPPIDPPAWWQQAPQAAPTAWQPAGPISVEAPSISPAGSFATDAQRQPNYAIERTSWQAPQAAPQFVPQTTPAAPPLLSNSPAERQYVEQTLDRASQNLLNGVGEYLFRQADPARVPPPDTSPAQRTPPVPQSVPTLPPSSDITPISHYTPPQSSYFPQPHNNYAPPPQSHYVPPQSSFTTTPVAAPTVQPATPPAASPVTQPRMQYQPQPWRRY